jgi:hypothetical protein
LAGHLGEPNGAGTISFEVEGACFGDWTAVRQVTQKTDRPEAAQQAPAKAMTPKNCDSSATVEERLRALDRLHAAGLVNESELAKKRQEILKCL